MYTKSIIWYSQWLTPWYVCPMAGVESHQKRYIPIITTHQRKRKHHHWLPLKEIPTLRWIPHNNLQIHYSTTYSSIIPNKNTAQKEYLMDIVSHRVFHSTKVIPKPLLTSNLETDTGGANYPHMQEWSTNYCTGSKNGSRKILVSSFAAYVQRKQFGTTNKTKLLHGTLKAAISNVTEFFQKNLQSDPTLYSSEQKSLILQRKLTDYKSLYPSNKH